MKSVQKLTLVKVFVCLVVALGFVATASASCGDTMSAMAAAATAIRSSSAATPQEIPATGDSQSRSIVGLWHVFFAVGGQNIQEAYQVWNAGGTEVHNPNVDPRAGSVCLGVWAQASTAAKYKLSHRVWNYDVNGNFLGTIKLTEKVAVSKDGNSHSGSFTLDFYDPTGAFLTEVSGNVSAERIGVE